MGIFKKTPADVHAAAVAKRDEWSASLDSLRAELAAAEAQQPESPADVDALGTTWARLTQSIRITSASLAAAELEVTDAARVLVREAADALDEPIARAEAEIREIDARKDELLAALEAHTGRHWQVIEHDPNVAYIGGPDPSKSFASEVARRRGNLRNQVRDLRARQAKLRAAAEGDDVRRFVVTGVPEPAPASSVG